MSPANIAAIAAGSLIWPLFVCLCLSVSHSFFGGSLRLRGRQRITYTYMYIHIHIQEHSQTRGLCKPALPAYLPCLPYLHTCLTCIPAYRTCLPSLHTPLLCSGGRPGLVLHARAGGLQRHAEFHTYRNININIQETHRNTRHTVKQLMLTSFDFTTCI